jgi:hypothetical protein
MKSTAIGRIGCAFMPAASAVSLAQNADFKPVHHSIPAFASGDTK